MTEALRRIRRDEARLGMFVHAVDGSWLKHPFWRAQFLLTEAAQLRRLLDADIETLVIDEVRGVPLVPPVAAAPAPPPDIVAAAPPARRPPPRPEPTVPVAAERPEAARVMRRAQRAVEALFGEARLGRPVRGQALAPLVEEITASVERNAGALIELTRLKSKHAYTYLHSVAVCALMVNLARHLNLREAEVRTLGLAGLLHDVGKMAVPDQVLDKPGPLTEAELQVVRGHPEQGHRMLSEGEGVPAEALDVCLHHHERMDGTGYPHRLCGGAFTLPARMGAICDVWDALTSNRPYKAAWTPQEAIAAMHGWDGHFDPELLFRFMQSIGVYPPGLLVELRSNRLGVVLPLRRAGPARVRAFLATRTREALPAEDVELGDSLASDQIVAAADPLAWGLHDWEERRLRLLGERARAA